MSKLLEDRFKLKMILRLTGCYEGPGPDGKDPRVANRCYRDCFTAAT